MDGTEERWLQQQAEKKTRAAERWKHFRESSNKTRKKLLDHSFALCIDDIGAGWEYVHFELDGKTVSSFRISYIGPDLHAFLSVVRNLKEKDFAEVVFMDEPGEHPVLLSRRMDNIYIKLPGMEDGFFMKYAGFVAQITEELEKNDRS